MTVQHVTDYPATAPEQIEFFAKKLSGSDDARRVFMEICRGQSKQAKTAEEIAAKIGLSAKRVLEIATPLSVIHLFEKTKRDGRIAYRKYPNINSAKHQIIRLATNKKKLEEHVTVRNPRRQQAAVLKIALKPGRRDVTVDVKHVTIDDIEEFRKVRSLKAGKLPDELDPARLPETQFKNGVRKILGNKGTFKDWGGEKNDLFSTHLRINGKRHPAAVAFKGPGKTGVLTPGKLGKNGDQIQRLFSSAAQVFFIQYEGEIAESVLEQMQQLAIAKSVTTNTRIYYGIIALEDSYRLRIKYEPKFA